MGQDKDKTGQNRQDISEKYVENRKEQDREGQGKGKSRKEDRKDRSVPSAEVLDDPRQPAEVCTLTDTLSLMWSTIGRIVRTAVEPAVAALGGRLAGLHAQLSGDSDLPADAQSGIYVLQPGLGQPVPALCDQDTDGGGWTVFQRRADIQPRQDFFLGWEAYKWGFGALDGEFWWGLENLWLVTAQLDRRYQVRVDLEDFEGDRRHAVYDGFSVASERNGYRLTVANYTGTAGDSLLRHSGLKFSTKDRDQDTFERGSCALNHKGGWWYGHCHSSNLNGRYLAGNHSSYADGVNWIKFRGHYHSLKSAEMKMRPMKKL
ncbi:Techylectin-5B [Amphibalanus amphitrite]|uniref:Techylectin-5B n=1 Tax=Amphibalanus amphitrite TaxID=1232801 RepID=A0A6A4W6R8_AMPAM|nr:Techylectin-5B [Amphibalanus amphitrite]